MSLTLRGFALRVCYFLGYYEKRLEILENQLALLKKQNDMLVSTQCFYIEYCDYPGCPNWCIDGTKADKIDNNDIFPVCDVCFGNGMCHNHRVNWKVNDNGENVCGKCRNL